ncbi:MAG: hypothetical protein HC840_13355 [Leptolyngbyaceae cyanobacterium RM2_2_4]|nr:hypothetical protein [Leptolyngbyaceae cyanobacterium RM2_2_4]
MPLSVVTMLLLALTMLLLAIASLLHGRSPLHYQQLLGYRQTDSPHPRSLSQNGRGTSIRLPFSRSGRRGWGMRANLQNWDAPSASDLLYQNVLSYHQH